MIWTLSQGGKRKSNGRQCFDLFPKKAKAEASPLLSTEIYDKLLVTTKTKIKSEIDWLFLLQRHLLRQNPTFFWEIKHNILWKPLFFWKTTFFFLLCRCLLPLIFRSMCWLWFHCYFILSIIRFLKRMRSLSIVSSPAIELHIYHSTYIIATYAWYFSMLARSHNTRLSNYRLSVYGIYSYAEKNKYCLRHFTRSTD